ncbi:hypothetical protein [Streptomyces sp. NPDC058653]|uniref:hypothetical protein n=1 Tax=Streptomyces sp. NPDC058653 TaxID=3346576 RepID=UPI00366580B1
MPLDKDLAARMTKPDFWPLYLFDDEATEAYDEEWGEEDEEELFRTEFSLGQGLGLELEFEPGLTHVNLGVVSPGVAEAETVGWDDMAHFHPHVMPWSELDLLCRAAALHDPALRHPGPMLALLLRFAFLAEDADPDAITPLVDAAFAVVRPAEAGVAGGLRDETRDLFEPRDLRGTGIEWTTRPDGCRAVTQHGRDRLPLYSLREPESDGFPFAAWSALLARASEVVGAVQGDPALRNPEVRAALDSCAEPDGHRHLGPLATALAGAGFDHPVLLRAVSEPVAPAEAAWAVETLAGLPQGELIPAWSGASRLIGGSSRSAPQP